MRAAFAQRQIVLAGVALLAAIGALALTSHGDHAKATGLHWSPVLLAMQSRGLTQWTHTPADCRHWA